MDKIKFTPSALTSSRGALHMLQVIMSVVTFIVSAIRSQPSHTYWIYCMVIWGLCPLLTLFITIIETLLIHKLILYMCMDWDDFTTGMAMMSSLTTFACAVVFGNFYAHIRSPWGLAVTILACITCVLYCIETFRDKRDSSRSATYVAALPGFLKVLEAFVSCIIYVSLIGYRGRPALYVCIVAYVIPFPIIPVIIVTNIFTKLKSCLPFNIDRLVLIFLIVSVLLYVLAAVLWPVYSFRDNPRPKHCPGNSCIWSIQFTVTFFTYLNLLFFILDLVFTCLGLCGFKKP
ncbi:myeloid-associated differentiation marker-like protein 2 [Astyanax mexicanus]|uniref:myeloid-associated differentiation marker-like protein 2 n=1 Tax=Astyanax mexicanus TaxID=7994 RepID=UPI0020CB0C10|nr:myeloid-associated differentiation marker-like protein 2 [Astyanax mexicanus]